MPKKSEDLTDAEFARMMREQRGDVRLVDRDSGLDGFFKEAVRRFHEETEIISNPMVFSGGRFAATPPNLKMSFHVIPKPRMLKNTAYMMSVTGPTVKIENLGTADDEEEKP